ncbi:MAG: leucyl/phenylalanyl-tRNA--protein transferase [Desulfovibrio sp.]|nr:leucyl/phenylalanyl-tRNA--protein transferase [Desulfovibrio sp.]
MRKAFPPVEMADEQGLLCFGGDLRPERLLAAYSLGIFPWYDKEPLLWWSLDPRCILPLSAFHLPKRSQRTLKNHPFALTMDTAFSEVIVACAAPRTDGGGTWITPAMQQAYCTLHTLGFAHSVEAWQDGELVGGLYGVGLERAFFGESMFHRRPEASRAALAGLVAFLRLRNVVLLDCQQETPHMMAMGAQMVDQATYQACLVEAGLGRGCSLSWKPWSENTVFVYESSSWSEKSK